MIGVPISRTAAPYFGRLDLVLIAAKSFRRVCHCSLIGFSGALARPSLVQLVSDWERQVGISPEAWGSKQTVLSAVWPRFHLRL
jgi:hypothetical protein